MPTTINSTRHTYLPTTRAVATNGDVFAANGLDPAKRYNGTDASDENAGVEAAVNGSFSGAWSGSGSITGTYYYAFRFIDDEGNPGELSELQSAAASSDTTITYSNVPVGSDSRTAGRQIFRSIAGENAILFLDVQIDDNSTTSDTSTNSDATLLTQTALQINAPDQSVNADRFGIPPSFMRVVVYASDRTFWLVPATYKEGHAEVSSGSATVTIVGGTVTSAMDGRLFQADGDDTIYTIDSVDTSANTLTLDSTYAGATNKFALYSVFPPLVNRRRVYWSYAGEPESVPAEFAWDVEADLTNEEDLTGGIRFGSFIYLTTAHNIYRWSFTTDPGRGAIYHTESRGMLNQRCHCRFENMLAMMDRTGIYIFNGGNANPVGHAIHDFFREKIVWDNAEWFHASAFPAEECVKFFVCLDGSRYPRHSIDYNYRNGRWWWCEYPWEIAASCVVPVASKRELIVGAEQERVLIHDKWSDVPETVGTKGLQLSAKYDVTSATNLSVTVSPDWFSADHVLHAPISVISGRGAGQTRRIMSANASTGRIEIDRPWNETPDTTSDVAIGAVHCLAATKEFEIARESDGRYLDASFQPLDNHAVANLRSYYNFSASAAANASSFTRGAVSADKSRVDTQFNMARTVTVGEVTNLESDGYFRHGLEGGFDNSGPSVRYVELEIDAYQTRDQVTVHSLDIEGVTP